MEFITAISLFFLVCCDLHSQELRLSACPLPPSHSICLWFFKSFSRLYLERPSRHRLFVWSAPLVHLHILSRVDSCQFFFVAFPALPFSPSVTLPVSVSSSIPVSSPRGKDVLFVALERFLSSILSRLNGKSWGLYCVIAGQSYFSSSEVCTQQCLLWSDRDEALLSRSFSCLIWEHAHISEKKISSMLILLKLRAIPPN